LAIDRPILLPIRARNCMQADGAMANIDKQRVAQLDASMAHSPGDSDADAAEICRAQGPCPLPPPPGAPAASVHCAALSSSSASSPHSPQVSLHLSSPSSCEQMLKSEMSEHIKSCAIPVCTCLANHLVINLEPARSW
jgi:hypothetical protein